MFRGKKYQNSAKQIDRSVQYDSKDAFELICKTASAKFDETVELHVKLGGSGLADQLEGVLGLVLGSAVDLLGSVLIFLTSKHLSSPPLFTHDNAHAAGRAGDHAHGGFQAGGVQVGHLGLGDLLHISLADDPSL